MAEFVLYQEVRLARLEEERLARRWWQHLLFW
jgi:hypothetical protein